MTANPHFEWKTLVTQTLDKYGTKSTTLDYLSLCIIFPSLTLNHTADKDYLLHFLFFWAQGVVLFGKVIVRCHWSDPHVTFETPYFIMPVGIPPATHTSLAQGGQFYLVSEALSAQIWNAENSLVALITPPNTHVHPAVSISTLSENEMFTHFKRTEKKKTQNEYFFCFTTPCVFSEMSKPFKRPHGITQATTTPPDFSALNTVLSPPPPILFLETQRFPTDSPSPDLPKSSQQQLCFPAKVLEWEVHPSYPFSQLSSYYTTF